MKSIANIPKLDFGRDNLHKLAVNSKIGFCNIVGIIKKTSIKPILLKARHTKCACKALVAEF